MRGGLYAGLGRGRGFLDTQGPRRLALATQISRQGVEVLRQVRYVAVHAALIYAQSAHIDGRKPTAFYMRALLISH